MPTLHEKLIAASLPVNGTAIEGQTVLFTRSLTGPEEVAYEMIVNPGRFKQIAARATAQAIPDWAAWTPEEWTTWRNANISSTQITAVANLADAKAIMQKMSTVIDNQAKMLIALRDHTRLTE